MIITGIVFLLIGTLIARPYCRFFCPYGVLLNWMSRLSKYHATVTPTDCVKCRLCEPACPFDAIEFPRTTPSPETRAVGLRRLVVMLFLLPVLIGATGWSVSRVAPLLARQNPTVRLSETLRLNQLHPPANPSPEVTAFSGSGIRVEALEQRAATIQVQFRIGSWLLGGFLGAVLGFRLIGSAIKRRREIYEPNKGTCLSCARCYLSCPEEHQRQLHLEESGHS
jgi:NAD-dependent dihydropyrimidine dehydrogenase PreA subunit